MKIIYFIDKEDKIQEIQSSSIDTEVCLKYIGLNDNICNKLKKRRLKFECLDSYGSSDYQKKAFNFLNKFSKSRINGIKIKELLNYENLSLWNFIVSSLYSGSFYYSIADIIKYTELISKCIEKENPTKIIYFDDGELISDILNHGIHDKSIERIKIRDYKKKIIHKLKIESKRIFIILFLFASIIRKLYYIILNFNTNLTRGNDILMFSGDQFREFYNPFTRLKISGDPYYEYLFDELSKKHSLSFVGFNTAKPYLNLSIIKKRINRNELRFSYTPFEYFLSLSIIIKSIKISRTLKKQFFKKFDEVKSNKTLAGEDQFLHDKINKILNFYLSIYVVNIIAFYEACKNILRLEKPSITISSESGIETLCLVAAAKRINLPNIGIQHGVISNNNPTYITNDDFMFPDYTLVGGEHWKNLIINHSKIPQKRIIITGIPRYDLLANVGELYNKKDFFARNKIPLNHKIILWTADFHSINTENNIKELRAIFETFNNKNNILLIIKPHPGDTDRQIKLVKSVSEGYKTNFIIANKDSDTYELLSHCDILLTRNSTTALEAVALKKPVIIINFNKEVYNPDYVKDGIALGAFDKEELNFLTKKVLKEKTIFYNKEKFQKIRLTYFFRLDGNSTERVINYINYIKNKKF